MLSLTENLILDRCPHCSVANPNLRRIHHFQTNNHKSNFSRSWSIYVCATCGGAVSAWAPDHNAEVRNYYPVNVQIESDIPDRPRNYLTQAHESLHAPAGAIMLAASAVDSMLKLKSYANGSLYSRIDAAAASHVITQDMATWAHAIRLDANDQRHADESAELPTEDDARRVLDFATTLAQIMFVLPKRIERGLQGKE